jgi:hypothetical protein
MFISIAALALTEATILVIAINSRRKSPWTCHSPKVRGRCL